MTRRCLAAAALVLWFTPGRAAMADSSACAQAIAAAERAAVIPEALLGAIALAESGRADPVTGRVAPWPWTLTVGGVGRYYATKAEAVDAVQIHRALGADSIDVGCMQVNLRHHPAAFASLDLAFDPASNVAYAASFLRRLYQQGGTWPWAVAAYHSQTPELGARYWSRVSARWPLAARFAADAPHPAQGPAQEAAREPGRTPPVDDTAARNRTPGFAARVREAEEDRRRNLARVGLPPSSLARAFVPTGRDPAAPLARPAADGVAPVRTAARRP